LSASAYSFPDPIGAGSMSRKQAIARNAWARRIEPCRGHDGGRRKDQWRLAPPSVLYVLAVIERLIVDEGQE
jgi:hypothetical protein